MIIHMYKEKHLRIRKNKINISFLLETLYPYLLLPQQVREKILMRSNLKQILRTQSFGINVNQLLCGRNRKQMHETLLHCNHLICVLYVCETLNLL